LGATATVRPTTPAKTGLFSGAMALLAAGHLTTDLFSSAVPALQPILVERFSLTLTQAGVLSGLYMFSSSVLQLPAGILADRFRSRLYTVFGPLIAGVFLSLLCAATGFPVLLGLVFLGGVGVALFHPQSTSEAARLSGERKGLGMALFITAGTLGMAFGPPYFAAIIDAFGETGLPVAMTPAFVLAAVLLWKLPAPHATASKVRGGVDWSALRAHAGPLGLLYALVCLRSTVQLGVGQFLTLYLVNERAFTIRDASFILGLFFLAAAVGSIVGGSLADRWGGKIVGLISMAGAAPTFALFLATDGWVSIGALFLGAFCLLLTIPVFVVMAQQLVPEQAGTVSSLMMGFAWGMAGVTLIPLTGWVADQTTLHTALWGVALLPVLGLLLTARLPRVQSSTAR